MARPSGKKEAERPAALSRERILDAAGKLVEREGPDRLSMRRLAQALDVWPMALYRYFEDKDALLDAIVDRAAGDVARRAGEGTWREQMRELLHEARAALGRGGLGERIPRAMLTPGVQRLSEEGLAILHAAGCPEDEAARAWHALLSYTVGSTLTGSSSELADARAADAGFDYGLERLLDGLAASLESPAVAS
jgi:TetR/AcrR family transcriptional regulator, tetracycline repressor protein